jgi:MerR family transcriptional regulator, copper efflux regulator
MLTKRRLHMTQELLSIGKLATLVDTVTDNIRFYERKGLIPVPSRSKGGYRQYTPDTVNRVRFIRRAKALKFSLKDIQELLELSDNPASC